MSTPCFVGILHTSKEVELVYIHYDGYPHNGTGANLLEHFNSFEKAKEIVSNGARDCIINKQVKYYDDKTLTFSSWEDLKEHLKKRPDIFYVYVWNEPVSRWEFIKCPNNQIFDLKNLTEFLSP